MWIFYSLYILQGTRNGGLTMKYFKRNINHLSTQSCIDTQCKAHVKGDYFLAEGPCLSVWSQESEGPLP